MKILSYGLATPKILSNTGGKIKPPKTLKIYPLKNFH